MGSAHHIWLLAEAVSDWWVFMDQAGPWGCLPRLATWHLLLGLETCLTS